jgi:hypothetical protein
MDKIYVNVEGPIGTRDPDYIVSLTIGDRHFIDNQYKSPHAALIARTELITTYSNFAMGKNYGIFK